jgi:hypothetical protein
MTLNAPAEYSGQPDGGELDEVNYWLSQADSLMYTDSAIKSIHFSFAMARLLQFRPALSVFVLKKIFRIQQKLFKKYWHDGEVVPLKP